MGHVWLGFAEEQIADWCKAAGLADLRSVALPAEAQAKGPTLFITTAVKDGRRQPKTSRVDRHGRPSTLRD
jgi:hypothetical protein